MKANRQLKLNKYYFEPFKYNLVTTGLSQEEESAERAQWPL